MACGTLGNRWPINGQTFCTWVDEVLVPVLHSGDIVVLDNLGSHTVAGIEVAMAAAGARWCYRPPYSPDFNPIEQMFSKMKTSLRTAARRTIEDLRPVIGELMDAFTTDECDRYIGHAGYGKST
jgi:transposase